MLAVGEERRTRRRRAHDCDEMLGGFRRTDAIAAGDWCETRARGRKLANDRATAHDCDETRVRASLNAAVRTLHTAARRFGADR
jgi:hypothetical protein